MKLSVLSVCHNVPPALYVDVFNASFEKRNIITYTGCIFHVHAAMQAYAVDTGLRSTF